MGRELSRAPFIQNITLTTAGTEYPVVLASDFQVDPSIKAIQIKSKENSPMQYGYVAGGPYVTIPAGQTYWHDEFDCWVLSVFLKGTVNGQTCELEYWI